MGAKRPATDVIAPVVSPDSANGVFARWVDEFDIWTGWHYTGAAINRRHLAQMRFAERGEQYIYLAAAPRGPVKVGLSENPIHRVRALPGYAVVATISHQDRSSERQLHEALRDLKINTRRDAEPYLGIKYEWFSRAETLCLAYRLANAADSRITARFGSGPKQGAA